MGLHQAGELGANAKYVCYMNICDAVCGSWLPRRWAKGLQRIPRCYPGVLLQGVQRLQCERNEGNWEVYWAEWGQSVSLQSPKASGLLSSASWVIFCAQSQCKHNFSPQSPEEWDGAQRGEIRQGVVRDTDLAATSNVRNADSFLRENSILPNFSRICLWSLVWETLA